MSTAEFEVRAVPTRPIAGQKTGTSGLRKKVKEFSSEHYLENWVQSLFLALHELGHINESTPNATLVVGGDGRYYNREALQTIIKISAANGVAKLIIGQNGILSTPAVSALIRARRTNGGIILTASHNPGGQTGDFGIKFNIENGAPAPEKITDAIYTHTTRIGQYKLANIPEVDLSALGEHKFGKFSVEIVDSVDDYWQLMKSIFPIDSIKKLVARPEFKVRLDSMNGVTGAYTQRIFRDELGMSADSLVNSVPKEDFGGEHPDPNLTYAKALVDLMNTGEYEFGAAWDGDGDRNMVLGRRFFVNPSDSVAIIAANAKEAIPYFAEGLGAVARSMPTSAALDRVAAEKGLKCFEVPTGWKFFCNVMDNHKGVICGEESFGTGSDHIREKDGIWAVLAWLSILAYKNAGVAEGGKLVTVEDIVKEHWAKYGRNYFSRYDYEECDAEPAAAMMKHVGALIASASDETIRDRVQTPHYKLAMCDDFEYTDPFDSSVAAHQGYRFVYADGSRIIFRLSGTGSVGATIRLYVEKYEADADKQSIDPQDALKPLIDLALNFSELSKYTGRHEPTVIT
ncbi:Phosphoglucomutase, putative [Acanthamoeba castellanii str. Neff]|uniref:phosphoglucomutase (alpha-D-glucose-1,6-bisphosphate-dependent) n=1 Tax=Acanthamoeba castellanii (strain ATCC 30010 / Neff) TaxID=1257118 RepID=L8GV41_ACACF|nr:Phosphoglucomutase, putative [Acanthamoeba castellanii str. Neff]ELR16875.1 Phosphoglucomutase, putative [Acanthamoeba castellanii str. Neff]